MTPPLSRRAFVKSSLLASAALPLTATAQNAAPAKAAPSAEAPADPLPLGKIAGQPFSRLMLGGNLLSGHAHARDLGYVAQLMRNYNTDAKVRETLELAERHGITTLNSWVMDNNRPLFDHWKAGGKLKWIAQVRFDGNGGFDQARRAAEEGAAAIHLTGDAAERLLAQEQFVKAGEMLQFIRDRKRLAGLGAHDLVVVQESERRQLNPDFYVKTFHTHEYYSAPRTGESGPVGRFDNYWCSDPQAVVDTMAEVAKPWIAFKILAAGAIAPRSAFPHAFNSGADFILVGMFDWQIAENATLARRVLSAATGPNSKRTRPWYG